MFIVTSRLKCKLLQSFPKDGELEDRVPSAIRGNDRDLLEEASGERQARLPTCAIK
jgi:hypothetical protein